MDSEKWLVGDIVSAVGNAANAVAKTVDKAADAVGDAAGDAAKAVAKTADSAVDAVGDAAKALGKGFENVENAVVGLAGEIGNDIKKIAGTLWSLENKIIMAAIQKGIDFINSKSSGPKFALKFVGCSTLNPCKITASVTDSFKKNLKQINKSNGLHNMVNFIQDKVDAKNKMHTISHNQQIDLIPDQKGLVTLTSKNTITFKASATLDLGTFAFSMPISGSIVSNTLVSFTKKFVFSKT